MTHIIQSTRPKEFKVDPNFKLKHYWASTIKVRPVTVLPTMKTRDMGDILRGVSMKIVLKQRKGKKTGTADSIEN